MIQNNYIEDLARVHSPTQKSVFNPYSFSTKDLYVAPSSKYDTTPSYVNGLAKHSYASKTKPNILSEAGNKGQYTGLGAYMDKIGIQDPFSSTTANSSSGLGFDFGGMWDGLKEGASDFGNWSNEYFGTTGADGSKTGGLMNLGSLGMAGLGAWTGMKELDLQKDAFAHNVMDSNRNYELAKDAYDREVKRSKHVSDQMRG